MKQPLILLGALALTLLATCNCPPDEQVGSLALSAEALAFLPYSGSETLRFVANDGTEMTFTAPRGEEINSDRLCIRTTCTEARFGSPSSCDYHAAESRRYSYFSSDNQAVLDFLLYSELYTYNTTDFFDVCLVALSVGSPSMEATHVITPRFTGDFDPDDTEIMDQMELQSSLTLNGQTFQNVLSLEHNGLAVYLQEGTGLIGFKGGGKTWVLQP
ncbi:MAG: hypothetical protein KDC54_08125 [Lewinella sp.]|nr:hypothetical protein [Lewinella sp.]